MAYPRQAPGLVPGTGGHTQVQVSGTAAALALGRTSGFAGAWLLRKHFYCAEEWEIRALHHPAWLCAASLVSGWKAS